jgi:hypothetical protein
LGKGRLGVPCTDVREEATGGCGHVDGASFGAADEMSKDATVANWRMNPFYQTPARNSKL